MLSLTRRSSMIVIVAITALTGCSTADSERETSEPTPTTSAFEDYVAGLEEVDLEDVDRPDPPDGFDRADVDAFADSIIGMMITSVDPSLDELDPADAADVVMDGLYAASRIDYERSAARSTGDTPWQWLIASSVNDRIGEPRLVEAEWTAKTSTDDTNAGVRSQVLRLSLRAIYVHETATGSIVQQRTIGLSGFRPRGGPEWWPGLHATSTFWGADDCYVVETSRLAADPDTKDLPDARALIEDEPTDLQFDAETLEEFRSECRAGE